VGVPKKPTGFFWVRTRVSEPCYCHCCCSCWWTWSYYFGYGIFFFHFSRVDWS